LVIASWPKARSAVRRRRRPSLIGTIPATKEGLNCSGGLGILPRDLERIDHVLQENLAIAVLARSGGVGGVLAPVLAGRGLTSVLSGCTTVTLPEAFSGVRSVQTVSRCKGPLLGKPLARLSLNTSRYDNHDTGSYYYKNSDGSTYTHNYRTGQSSYQPPRK
jgi:hypothetical protein